MPFRFINVHFLVRHIQISRQNDKLARLILQLLQILKKVLIPVFDSIIQPFTPLSSIGRITRDQIELFIFQSENSPLSIMPVHTQIVKNTDRFELCKNRYSRIPSSVLRTIPVLLIDRRDLCPQLLVYFYSIGFCLV